MTRADVISERFVAPSDALAKRAPDDAGAEPGDGQSFGGLIAKLTAARDERSAASAPDAKTGGDAEQTRVIAAEDWLSLMAADAEPPLDNEPAAPCAENPESSPVDGSGPLAALPLDADPMGAAPSPKDLPPTSEAQASAALVAISIVKALSGPPQNDASEQPAADVPRMPGAPAAETEAATAARVATDLRVKVSVIHQETHFAPTLAPALQQELADRLSTAASPKETREAPTHSAGPAIHRTAQAAPSQLPTAVTEAPAVPDDGAGPSRGALFAASPTAPEPALDGNQETQSNTGRLAGTDTLAGPTVVASGQQPTPGQQIAGRILAELRSGADGLSAPQAGATPAKPATGSVMKVLHIRLQPADLGTVTIRMSLKDNALELHLEAARSETAQVIGKDKEALSHLLRSAGYRVDGLAVNVADMGSGGTSTGQPGNQGPASNPNFSSQAQPGWSHSNGGSSDAHARGGGRSENGPSIRSNNDAEDAMPARAGDALYV